MKLILWMLAGAGLSSAGITVFLGAEAAPGLRLAVWLGMLAPLATAVCSLLVMRNMHRKHPEKLMSVAIAAFPAKMIFLGGYVALVVKSDWVVTTPFAVSFTGYFLALHITEALHLRRLVTIT